jgi:hypothetical protein
MRREKKVNYCLLKAKDRHLRTENRKRTGPDWLQYDNAQHSFSLTKSPHIIWSSVQQQNFSYCEKDLEEIISARFCWIKNSKIASLETLGEFHWNTVFASRESRDIFRINALSRKWRSLTFRGLVSDSDPWFVAPLLCICIMHPLFILYLHDMKSQLPNCHHHLAALTEI